jgi:hypothetical protein
MGWIGRVRCKKFLYDSVALTCALVAHVRPILHWSSCSNETIQNAPNMSLSAIGWIGCARCERFPRDFVAPTWALIAVVPHILHRCSCSKETVRNAPKHEFECNRVDRVRSMRMILTRLRCMNLCTNCALIAPVRHVLHQISCSNEMVRNATKDEFGVH